MITIYAFNFTGSPYAEVQPSTSTSMPPPLTPPPASKKIKVSLKKKKKSEVFQTKQVENTNVGTNVDSVPRGEKEKNPIEDVQAVPDVQQIEGQVHPFEVKYSKELCFYIIYIS